MFINYTVEELLIIEKNRKPILERPLYYNSTTDQSEVISEDFEAYLILQTEASKQKILQRLRKNIKSNNDLSDRDALLKIFSDNIAKNSELKYTELETETDNFDEFRDAIVGTDQRFNGLKELSRLIEIIKKPIEEVSFNKDQAFHDGNVNILIGDRIELNKIDSDTKEEYDVWQKVISAYQGRS